VAKRTEKQNLVIIIAATVLLCSAAGGGIYWAKGLVEVERQAIEEKRKQIAAAEEKIKKIPDLEKHVIILRENVREYVKILPETEELNTFVRTINQFIAQSGIELEKFVPNKPKASSQDFEEWTYRFDFKATLWQFMKFVNFFENYERFVKVKSFTLTAGGNSNAEVEEAETQHRISMVVETYVYKGKANSKDVKIPNYDTKRTSLAEEIVHNLQAIRLDRYEFKDAHGRRDIFVDPREFGYSTKAGSGMPLQQQKKLIDDMQEEVTRLHTLQKRSQDKDITLFERYNLERTLRAGITELQTKIDEIEQKKVISYQPYRVKWTKAVMEPVANLRAVIAKENEVRDDRYLSQKDLTDLIANMKRDLEAGDLQGAEDRYNAVQEKVKIPPSDDRAKLADEVRELYVRAKIAREFSGQPMNITGVVVNEDGRSGLIVNGQVYMEGDFINDDLLVRGVAREQVEFVYKGFTLIKIL
jgi:Tfp pilus assembly protein PilO